MSDAAPRPHRPRRRGWLLALAFVLLCLGGVWLSLLTTVYYFAGVRGPATPSVITARAPALISDFAGGSPHRLAVLVTDPHSDWLGLARGLKAHGIPFALTTDVAEAVRHRVVYVYPMVSGRVLNPAALAVLDAHVAGGGALLAYDIEGGGLQARFGVEPVPSADHSDWMDFAGHPAMEDGQGVRFSRKGTEAEFDALAYRVAGGTVLARFADGQPALTCGPAPGMACVLGLDLGRLTARAQNGRAEAAARQYVNGYEPSLDRLYQWLARFYVEHEPMPWLIDTTPAGTQLSILLTHDIDYTSAVSSARYYAQQLRESGAPGTFFMQTKYVKDYNDDVFFTVRTLPDVRQLGQHGMELASHTVSHANAFKIYATGSGRELYPDYLPYVTSPRKAFNGSILGELRVSKFLLDRLAGGHVISFRSGYLSNPYALPQALAATGYAFDSSITANASLTHLPYRLTTSREDRSLEPVWEFPVTIEDENGDLSQRLDTSYQVISRVAADHGLVVVQIHPDVRSAKLAFEKRVIADWRGRAWFATLAQFGAWWRARDRAEIDVDGSPGAWHLTVRAPEALDRLRVLLPKARPEGTQWPAGIMAQPGALRLSLPAGSVAEGSLLEGWHEAPAPAPRN